MIPQRQIEKQKGLFEAKAPRTELRRMSDVPGVRRAETSVDDEEQTGHNWHFRPYDADVSVKSRLPKLYTELPPPGEPEPDTMDLPVNNDENSE